MRIVVVGAGIAGMAAAWRLGRHGVEVVVLEAADEVGGRTKTVSMGGDPVDLGGEWLGRRHVHLLGLVSALGLTLQPAEQLLRPGVWRRRGEHSLSRLPPLGPHELAAAARVIARGARLARRLDVLEPWRSPAAAALDQRSFGAWLREEGMGERARHYVAALAGSLASRRIDEMSLLHGLWWLRRGGGFLPALKTTFELRIAEGAQEVCRRAAARLGGELALAEPVAGVAQGTRSVRVTTGSGRAVDADWAIVTAQPGTLRAIAFEPELPPAQIGIDSLHAAGATKVVAVLAPGAGSRAAFALGGEPLSGAWRRDRHITGFAPPWSADAGRDELVADLAAVFGVAVTELAETWIERWADRPFVAGCDLGFAPGELTGLGAALRARHGRVVFAGSERSSWPNNMEGAAESGIRAAGEVLAG